MYYLGIDIGGTAVKLGIVDETGKIITSTQANLNFDHYQTPIMDTVLKTIQELFERTQVKPDELAGIGVSATGQIDTEKGIVIGGNIESWIGVNIKKQLEDKYHCPVTVINDANSMIIGEQWIGAAKGKQNVIGITVGTGIGGGIIVNGNILLGSHGIAGELGHMIIMEEGIPCACGNTGCYERYAATTALIRMVQEAYDDLNIKEAKEDINGILIFDYMRKGNPGIKAIIDEWIEHIATGLVSLTHIFNPSCIVIGGAVCQQEAFFMIPLREKILARIMPCFREGLEIQAAELKNDAGLIGAVYYNIRHGR